MKPSLHKFRVAPSSAAPLEDISVDMESPVSNKSKRNWDDEGQGNGSRTSVPACERCRRMKKKCSRTLPECTACVHSASKCSFNEAPSDNWSREDLERKIRLLTTFINDRHSAMTLSSKSPSNGDYNPSLDIDAITNGQGRSRDLDLIESGPGENLDLARSSLPQPRPSDDRKSITHQTARKFVNAYFRHVHRAYPFLNQKHVSAELETFVDPGREAPNAIYLIMAIGCTTLERAGELQPNSSSSMFSINTQSLMQECLSGAGEEAPIETLVLLGVWALFDPAASVWTIVGALGRQALFLGLSRKTENNHPWETERMRRLFWSIFGLDRMVSFSLGLHIAMVDHNMNIPSVGLTVDEFATSDRERLVSDLQTSRHVIALRQIEGEILDKIHLPSHAKVTSYSLADKTVIADGIRSQIENWYSQGCLTSPLATGSTDTSNLPFHSSVSWLSARYYNLLFMLYYPSHFNQDDMLLPRSELQRFVYQFIHASAMLLSQRQLPLNWITLYRMVPVCLLVLHCFDENSAHTMSTEFAMCAEIMEAYPSKWGIAQDLAGIFRQLAAFVSSIKASSPASMDLSWWQMIKTDAVEIAERALGRASAYNYIATALLKSREPKRVSPTLLRT